MACLSTAVFATSPGFAEDSAPPAETAGSDTGSRTVIRPTTPTTPATTVLDAERLGERAGADLPAAISGEPGLHIPRLGGLGSYATLRIRGSSAEQVLVSLDGIPLNPADGAPVDLSTLPVGPLSHVAIHRGRAPWSLGQTGLGGALRLETRRPQSLDLSGEIGTGSFGSRWLRAALASPNLTFAVDYLGTSGDFTFRDDGGTAWTTDDDRTATRQNAASDQVTLLARYDQPLGDWNLSLLDAFTHAERGLPSLGTIPTRESALTLTRNLAGLTARGPLGPLTVQWTAWFAAATTEVRDPLSEIGLAGEATTSGSLVPGSILTAHLPLTDQLTTSIHLAIRHEAMTGDNSLDRTIGSAANEIHLRLDDFAASAGIRIEAAPDLLAPSAFLELAQRFGLHRLHLAIHHTPRVPSLFERYGNLGLVLGNPNLTPESLTQLELGARLDLSGDSHQLHVAALTFASFADDLIQFVQNAQGISRPENLASARILGLELTAELTLFDHLSLRSSLALLDARDTSAIAARTGKRLPLRPAITTAHRLEFRYPDAALGTLHGAIGVALDVDYLAGNALDFANLVTAPPRTLVGLSAFARSDEVEVRLSLMNLTDDRVQDLAGYPLPGFTTHLSLRLLPQ